MKEIEIPETIKIAGKNPQGEDVFNPITFLDWMEALINGAVDLNKPVSNQFKVHKLMFVLDSIGDDKNIYLEDDLFELFKVAYTQNNVNPSVANQVPEYYQAIEEAKDIKPPKEVVTDTVDERNNKIT